jgi:hypothetical protein
LAFAIVLQADMPQWVLGKHKQATGSFVFEPRDFNLMDNSSGVLQTPPSLPAFL